MQTEEERAESCRRLSCFQVSSPHLAFSLPTCSDADSGESEELVLKSAETQMCQVADSFLFILNFLLVTFIQLCSELHRALKYTTIYIIYVYIYIAVSTLQGKVPCVFISKAVMQKLSHCRGLTSLCMIVCHYRI